LQREICEADPKPPSAGGDTALRGDLDTIVLKAMHRDPARRYRSVELRYLESRPVTARPDTLVYRLTRFSSRNRWGIAAAMTVALSLAAGTAVSLYQARIAQQRFKQVRKLAGRFIELHDDVARLPGSTQVREKLVATALDYLDNLAQSAGSDSELLHELAQAYQKVADAEGAPGQPNLGRTDDALRNSSTSYNTAPCE
jgi:eukaryotic-like serine/threonine-protein kinase